MELTDLEKSAYRSDAMPDGLTQPEQLLFLSFRALYREYRAGAINRKQARKEKSKLLETYKSEKINHDIYINTARMRNELSSRCVQIERNGCEMCKLAVKIFDGRERGEG